MKSILKVAALAASLCTSGYVFACNGQGKCQPQQQQPKQEQQQQQMQVQQKQQPKQEVQQQQPKQEQQQQQQVQSTQVGQVHSTQQSGEQVTDTSGSTSDQIDLRVLARLRAADQAEISVAQQALSKSCDQRVKDFAQEILDDHTRADQDIRDMVNADHLTLPAFTPTTPEEIAEANQEQAAMDKLSKLSGSDFDKEFAQDMVNCHQKLSDWLNAHKDDFSRSDVRDWVDDTALPIIQEHLKDAQQLVQELGA